MLLPLFSNGVHPFSILHSYILLQIMCLFICLIYNDLGPTKEYVCENAKPRGNEDKYNCNTLSFIINK